MQKAAIPTISDTLKVITMDALMKTEPYYLQLRIIAQMPVLPPEITIRWPNAKPHKKTLRIRPSADKDNAKHLARTHQ